MDVFIKYSTVLFDARNARLTATYPAVHNKMEGDDEILRGKKDHFFSKAYNKT